MFSGYSNTMRGLSSSAESFSGAFGSPPEISRPLSVASVAGRLARFRAPVSLASASGLVSSWFAINPSESLLNCWRAPASATAGMLPQAWKNVTVSLTLALWLHEVGAEKKLMYGSFERSEEHTSELQSLMRISYAVFCLKNKNKKQTKRRDNYYDRYK